MNPPDFPAGRDQPGWEHVIGAVDLYVHAEPDVIPRQHDDIDLALSLVAAGYAAAVHRHHYSNTAERTSVAQERTGFQLLGALLLNHTVGGIHPAAVEYALRMGAVWIGLPTVNSAEFHRRLISMPANVRSMLSLGSTVDVVDSAGRPLPEVLEVMDLTRQAGAALGLGYVTAAEAVALAAAAVGQRVENIVLSNPFNPAMGLSSDAVEAVLELRDDIWLEISAYQVHQSMGKDAGALDQYLELVRRVGVGRCLLSSDGGIGSAPPPPELLAWAASRFRGAGFDAAEVDRLVRSNPAAILSTRRLVVETGPRDSPNAVVTPHSVVETTQETTSWGTTSRRD